MDFSNLKNFVDFMASERTIGNAVAVYLNNELVFKYEKGYSNYEEQIPLNGNEMYNIYSCSKLATVTAGMQLLEKGKFLLNDPLYEYIPEFKEMYIKNEAGEITKAQNAITIGNLFSMTSGYDYNFDSEGFKKAKENTNGKYNTLETIKCIASDFLSFEPGTHWQYGLSHDILAGVVEVVSGKKFRDYVKDNIFTPLEMNESFYHHTQETLKRTAEQYIYLPETDGTEENVVKFNNNRVYKNVGKSVSHILGEEYDSGGAGIITTVSDYVKLMAALAGYGTAPNGERILSKYSVELMRTNRLDGQLLKDFCWNALVGCGYGLGVRTHINPAKSGINSSLGEFGWGGAAGATAIIDPKLNMGVFYARHSLNPEEEYYQPRLRNVVYSCLD